MSEKVVLAYSGGLDTSVILKWLIERGFEVVAFVADVGQHDDFDKVREKALKTGASKVYVEDLKEEFVTDFIFPAFKANALYEGRYLLGTALARPLIAKHQIAVAAREQAQYVSHGATGKGNDQVRFELTYYALNPKIKIIAPWKTPEFLAQFKGRSDLLAYAAQHGIEVQATVAKPYSEDDNLLHLSHEAGHPRGPEPAGRRRGLHADGVARARARQADAHHDDVQGRHRRCASRTWTTAPCMTSPLELFQYLNTLGQQNGIGRMDMVENRFVGIKSRGVYETPGGTILHVAHRDIESIAMDREVMRLRDMLTAELSQLIYYGFWYSPEMDFLMAAIDKSQEVIDGRVWLTLYKGTAYATARESSSSLYDRDLSSMDIEGGFNQQDSAGFIKINAVRLMAHSAIMQQEAQAVGTRAVRALID